MTPLLHHHTLESEKLRKLTPGVPELIAEEIQGPQPEREALDEREYSGERDNLLHQRMYMSL